MVTSPFLGQNYPPSWQLDPWNPQQLRWWDGSQWTATTALRAPSAPQPQWAQPSRATTAPPQFESDRSTPTPWGPDSAHPAEPTRTWFPTLRPLAFPAAVLGTLAMLTLVAVNLLGTLLGVGAAAALLGLFALGFSIVGFIGVAWYASRKWGTGRFVDDYGYRIKWIDLPLAVVGTIGLFISSVIVGLLLQALNVPDGSNLEGITDQINDDPSLKVPLFVMLFVLAGIVAPITEELLFRGAILRGLLSRYSIVPALLIQGAIFGAAHLTPDQGWGNISLLATLAVVGIGLGVLTWATGRLWPATLAHALFNCTSLVLLATTL